MKKVNSSDLIASEQHDDFDVNSLPPSQNTQIGMLPRALQMLVIDGNNNNGPFEDGSGLQEDEETLVGQSPTSIISSRSSKKSPTVDSHNNQVPIVSARRQSTNKAPRIVPNAAAAKLTIQLMDARNLALYPGTTAATAKIYANIEFEKNETRSAFATLIAGSASGLQASGGMSRSSSNVSISNLDNNNPDTNAISGSYKASPSAGNTKKKLGLLKSLSQSGLAAIFGLSSPDPNNNNANSSNNGGSNHTAPATNNSVNTTAQSEKCYVWGQNEICFDVTRADGDIIITLWQEVKSTSSNGSNGDLSSATYSESGDHFLGFVKVRPPKLSTASAKSNDNSYRLLSRQHKDKVTGEVRFKMTLLGTVKTLTIEDFQILKVLGRGSFGKVVMARKKDTNRIYAIKILNKKDIIERKEVEHTMTERNILLGVDSPFIVGLKFSFQSPAKLYLVMDFINGGELFFHLQKARAFSEDRARFYAAELTLALQHLHESNIVYRDLKPENIMLDSHGHVALADFGLCKQGVDRDNASTFCGTAEYLAPEVLAGRKYGKAVDWWSLGILIYELINGVPPFYSQNTHQMYKNILHSDVRFPSRMSQAARSIVQLLLDKNPRKRLGCGPNGEEDIKNHPFFASIDWDKLMAKQLLPPFKPKVSSDFDASNFDPVFTNEEIINEEPKGANGQPGNGNNTDSKDKTLSESLQQQFKGFSFDGEKRSEFLQERP